MRPPERTLVPLAAAILVGLGLAAQAEPPAVPGGLLAEDDIYRREVFVYQTGGRPDPFQPLITGEDIGVRASDLTLEGIIYSPDPRASLAIFSLPAAGGRTRLRVGQRIGSVTVAAIHPRRVDLREDQFGVSRIHSVELQRRTVPTREGAAAPQTGAPAPPPATTPAPTPPAAGGSRP